ncbi:MAG: phytanoyl-CoA dioxygenase family protein [Aestuariivirga sp.]|uniref:phytanoyl-CoA dioxygenase family protein n=1 Tax=Aestuariivirga sp. TaxID=2650926 RepID=UPI00301A1326
MLTEGDRCTFRDDGFVVVEDLIPEPLLNDISTHLAAVKNAARDLEYSERNMNLESPDGGFLAQTGAVKCFKGVLRAVFHLESRDEFFAELGEKGPMYHDVVTQLLTRRKPALLSVNFWAKSAVVGSPQPWHQDLAYLSSEQRREYAGALTAWIAVDEATEENGCLEFYPGSHRLGDLPHLGSMDPDAGEQIHLDVQRLFPANPPTPVELRPGSAVFFDGLVVHGSKANRSPRAREAISFSYVYQ